MNKIILREQINNYIDYCKERNMTYQTIHSKYYALKLFADYTNITDMRDCTNQDLNAWLDSMTNRPMESKVSPATQRKYQKDFKAFVIFLREDQNIHMPLKLTRLRRFVIDSSLESNHSYYSQHQIETALEFANKTEKLMIKLLFDTGLRLSEFQSIKIEDIDFYERSIRVIGKGRKHAKVYFTTKTSLLLQEFIQQKHFFQHDYLWSSQRNGDLPYVCTTLRAKISRPFLKAGFSDFHPHALRHSFATDLIDRGATLQEVQCLMRHSSSRVTEIYIHNLKNRTCEIYNRLKNGSGLRFNNQTAELEIVNNKGQVCLTKR